MKKFYKSKCIIAVFIIIVVVITLISYFKITKDKKQENTELTTEQKVEDFEYLYNILEENYPYFDVNKRTRNIDWLSNKDAYLQLVEDTKTDKEFFYILNLILRQLHNGHTNILEKGEFEYSKELYNTCGPEMQTWKDVLNDEDVQKRYDKFKEIKINNSDDDDSKNKTNIEDSKILIENKLAYIKYNSFNGLNMEHDSSLNDSFFTKVKDYPYLIIDIRGNGGGSTEYWEKDIVGNLIDKPIYYTYYSLMRGGDYNKKFMECRNGDLRDIRILDKEIIKNSPEEVPDKFKYYSQYDVMINPKNKSKDNRGFNGKIFLLTDESVFSASEAFASFCKSTKWATLVGEKTSGDGIGTDPIFMSLPNSKYVIRYSANYGLNPDGTSNEEMKTVPDIFVNSNVSKDIKDDEAVNTVINMINN